VLMDVDDFMCCSYNYLERVKTYCS
jgi:hypothetical protein